MNPIYSRQPYNTAVDFICEVLFSLCFVRFPILFWNELNKETGVATGIMMKVALIWSQRPFCCY